MDHSMETAPLTVTQPVQLELIDSTGASTPIEAELHTTRVTRPPSQRCS